jgi:hypothetical protein
LILSPVALVLPDPILFSTVGLSPATASAPELGTHTVTATATSTGGTPVPGATVNFGILTGPNTGLTGTGTTGALGTATFTYTDGGPSGTIGKDTIQASIGALLSNIVEMNWTGEGNPPICTAVVGSKSLIWPASHNLYPITASGATDPEGKPLTYSVLSIYQDELTNTGDAIYAIDGYGIGTATALVRGETIFTLGKGGNGRMYYITFQVTNSTGQSCQALVKVGVPHYHDANGTQLIDEGPLYNSTVDSGLEIPLGLPSTFSVSFWPAGSTLQPSKVGLGVHRK